MNLITDYLTKEQRPLKWLCQKVGISYDRFHKLKTLSNEELKAKVTLEEAKKIDQVISGFSSKLLG